MSRVINPNSAGKERNRLVKTVALAIRELFSHSNPDDKTRDVVAYLVLALDGIAKSIDLSVGPWEKRGYWVKADRFRMEWAWTADLCAQLRQALLEDDWPAIAGIAAKIAEKMSHIKISPRHRMGKPWIGAWRELQ